MSQGNHSVRANVRVIRERLMDELAPIVRDAVNFYRRRGEKTEWALRLAARDLGIGARRVKSWLYHEVYTIPAEEAEALRQARLRLHQQHLKVLRADVAAERMAVAAEKQRLQEAQQAWLGHTAA